MALKVLSSPVHGRGCFATRAFAEGEEVARVPVIVFGPEEMGGLHRTKLKSYLFYLKDGDTPDGPYFTALAMGPVSFCNHARAASCAFSLDEAAAEVVLVARRPLAAGEEITIDYGDYAEEIV